MKNKIIKTYNSGDLENSIELSGLNDKGFWSELLSYTSYLKINNVVISGPSICLRYHSNNNIDIQFIDNRFLINNEIYFNFYDIDRIIIFDGYIKIITKNEVIIILE